MFSSLTYPVGRNFGECHLFHYDQRLQNVIWDSEQGEW